jgi:hypothetical protein
MNSPEEKTSDAISTSGSALFDLDVNCSKNIVSKKTNNKKKNKIKPLFKVRTQKDYHKNTKNCKSYLINKNTFTIDIQIPNFLQDKIEMKKLEGEINNYENKIKNFSNEEKEVFITSKVNFINSIIGKYNLPLVISSNNYPKETWENIK